MRHLRLFLILVLIMLVAVFGNINCSKRNAKMAGNDTNFCETNGHDLELAALVKKATGHPLEPLPKVYDNPPDAKMGFCSKLETKYVVSDETALPLKEFAASKGYLVFVFDGDFANEQGVIVPFHHLAVLKGTDEFDIITWRQSNGCNYDIFADDIVKKLKTWKTLNDLVVFGVGEDWVQFKFKTLPQNMDTFASEVYKFCPDIVEQGTGTVAALKEEMQQDGIVFLWWD